MNREPVVSDRISPPSASLLFAGFRTNWVWVAVTAAILSAALRVLSTVLTRPVAGTFSALIQSASSRTDLASMYFFSYLGQTSILFITLLAGVPALAATIGYARSTARVSAFRSDEVVPCITDAFRLTVSFVFWLLPVSLIVAVMSWYGGGVQVNTAFAESFEAARAISTRGVLMVIPLWLVSIAVMVFCSVGLLAGVGRFIASRRPRDLFDYRAALQTARVSRPFWILCAGTVGILLATTVADKTLDLVLGPRVGVLFADTSNALLLGALFGWYSATVLAAATESLPVADDPIAAAPRQVTTQNQDVFLASSRADAPESGHQERHRAARTDSEGANRVPAARRATRRGRQGVRGSAMGTRSSRIVAVVLVLAAILAVAVLLAPHALRTFEQFTRGRLPVVGEWESEREAVDFRLQLHADGTGSWESSEGGLVRIFGGGNVGGVDLTSVDAVAAEFTWVELDNGEYSIHYTGAWPMAGGRRVDATSPDLVAMTMNGYHLYSLLTHDDQGNKVTLVSKGTAADSSPLVFVRPGQPKIASAQSVKPAEAAGDTAATGAIEVPDVFDALSKHEFVATQEDGGMIGLWDESVEVVTDTLTQAGLEVRIVEVTQDTEGSQDPAAGTEVKKGTTVTVELPVPGWFGD